MTDDLYVLSRTRDSVVRYAPLYIHRFALRNPHKFREAAQLEQKYRSYEEIQNIPDKLRWLRHSRGLIQSEVAQLMEVSKSVYSNIESGTMQHIPMELADKMAAYYGVSRSDFMDEYGIFLHDGQTARITAYRKRLGMGRKQFARYTGIPLTSVREWENGKKVISRKCWERYFMGRA